MSPSPARFRPSATKIALAAPLLLLAAPLAAAPVSEQPTLQKAPKQLKKVQDVKKVQKVPETSTTQLVRFTSTTTTVRDNTTGLTWERAPAETKYDWNAAKARCEKLVLDGHKDWRIPRVEEMKTLFETVPPDTFLVRNHPFTVSTQQRWTSTGNPATRSAILVSNGGMHYESVTNSIAVWCVRGGANTAYPASNPRFQYVEGTNYNQVRDTQTGITWKTNGTTFGDWNHARSQCSNVGNGWRLATEQEYAGLMDPNAPGSPKLPVGHPFGNTYPPTYDVTQRWTSTQPTTTTAVAVRLSDTSTATLPKTTGGLSGMCVKGDPTTRFALLDADAVLDHSTMLVWARSPVYVEDTHAAQQAMCAARNTPASPGWRLPTVGEFQTILDYQSPTKPKLVAGHMFTGLRSDSYQMMWTADAATAVAFKTVDIGTAQVTHGGYHKDNKHWAWCVRSNLQ